jgi:hypothetical protein
MYRFCLANSQRDVAELINSKLALLETKTALNRRIDTIRYLVMRLILLLLLLVLVLFLLLFLYLLLVVVYMFLQSPQSLLGVVHRQDHPKYVLNLSRPPLQQPAPLFFIIAIITINMSTLKQGEVHVVWLGKFSGTKFGVKSCAGIFCRNLCCMLVRLSYIIV